MPHPSPRIGTLFTLIVFSALSAFPASAPTSRKGAGETPALRITLGPDSNVCGITVPPAPVKPAHKIGLIVWLHGGMRSGNREKGAEAHRAILPFVDPKAFYLCSPSAFGGEDWLTPKGQEHIENLIGYMLSHYPINPADINLVGVSDGTLGVIAYSANGKRAIHRRVLISCYPQIVIPPESLPGQAKFATGSWDFLQGGHDRLFPVQEVLPYLQRWESLYPNAHLHYFPEGEHDFSYYVANASDLLKGLFLPVTAKALKSVKPLKSGPLQSPN